MTTLHSNSGATLERLRPPGPRHSADGMAAMSGQGTLSQIEACIPALRRYAVALLRSRGAADELVRDCLWRALDTLHTRPDATDVRAWLFALMHTMFVGRRRRRRFRVLPAMFGGTESRQPCTLLHGLEHLPDEQRSAVLLVSVEDLSYPEAAAALGVPARTMLSHLARGREWLRQFTNTDRGPVPRRVKWAVTPAA